MNILNALKQLRDDIKTWVTNNLNALNAKIDAKTIPIDSKLSSTSTNPVQNKAIKEAIDNIPKFSGDYNDLTNAPGISEDGSGNMIIADESGNIIFKADADGIHTTAVSLNGEAAASEKYVDEAVANIDIPEVDFTGYATEEFVGTAIDSAKEELSESIVAESDEWKVVDEAGNIIFSVDASGAHTTELTLNGEAAATESYVDDAIAKIPKTDLTDYATKKYVDDAVDDIEIPSLDGYATETYVNKKVADLVNSAPEALNTLGELATALENHEDAYDALLETVGGKATKQELEDMKSELSESIVSEADEWKVVDEAGNIIFSVDASGAHTTSLTLNGQSVEDMIDDKVDKVSGKGLSTNDFTNEYKNAIDNLSDDTFVAEYGVTTFTQIEEARSANKALFCFVDSLDGSVFPLAYFHLDRAVFVGDASSGKKQAICDMDGNWSLENIAAFEETDPTVPAWAKEANKPTYTAAEVGLGNVDNTSDLNKPVSTATQNAINNLKNELSESIVSEATELTIVDEAGNIVTTIDELGLETTTVRAQNIVVNGNDIEDLLNDAGDFTINATIDANGNGTVDKTAAEITAALEAGRTMVCNATYGTSTTLIRLSLFSSGMATSTILRLVFANQNYKVTIRIVDGSTVNVSGEIVHFDITIGDTTWSGDEPVDFTDTINGMINSGAQSDWNQVDETATDYIKNKPCGIKTGIVLPETTIYDYLILADLNLIDNEEYTVYWNQVPYTCTARYEYNSESNIFSFHLDNDIFHIEYAPIIYTLSAQGGPKTEENTFTLKIEGKYIEKLSSTYLSDDLYGRYLATLFPETTITTDGHGEANNLDIILYPDRMYNVKWNGVTYSGWSYLIDNVVRLGNWHIVDTSEYDTLEPFVIDYHQNSGTRVCTIDPNTTATLQIEGEVNNQIPDRYIPSFSGTTEVTNPIDVIQAMQVLRKIQIQHQDSEYGLVVFNDFTFQDSKIIANTVVYDENNNLILLTLIGFGNEQSWEFSATPLPTGSNSNNILIAEYGTTTFNEIFEAVQTNGKTAFCRTSTGSTLPLAYAHIDEIKFVGNTFDGEQEAICTMDNVWSLNDVEEGTSTQIQMITWEAND